MKTKELFIFFISLIISLMVGLFVHNLTSGNTILSSKKEYDNTINNTKSENNNCETINYLKKFNNDINKSNNTNKKIIDINNTIYKDDNNLTQLKENKEKNEDTQIVDVNFTIYFKYGTKIKKNSMDVIENEIYDLLKNSNKKVLLIGYASYKKPKKVSNKRLSIYRALEVKKQIISLGIKEEQILTDGKGDSKLINSKNPQDPKNQRVEVIIYK